MAVLFRNLNLYTLPKTLNKILYDKFIALQPWTPCLPIRGGKLSTSKPFSTSNPQLPFLCTNSGVPFANNTNVQNPQPNSTNSLNNSFIWREVSPNNFNLYSSSVSSLNANGMRYSQTGSHTTPPLDYRALSEERATRKSLNRLKSGFGSGYDNIFITPLLSRKQKPCPKVMRHQSSAAAYQSTVQRAPPRRNLSAEEASGPKSMEQVIAAPGPGLYDRRLNRSFDAPSARYAGYGGGYLLGNAYQKNVLRRSTPHLAGEELNDSDEVDCHASHRGCTKALLGNGGSENRATANENQRQSGSWCCGNFVMKQWRKINNY